LICATRKNPRSANFRGDLPIYPASVVKMFYMAALDERARRRKNKITPELERGLKDMIVDSSNDATHYIFDVLTDAPGGGELSPEKNLKFTPKNATSSIAFFKRSVTNASTSIKKLTAKTFTGANDNFGTAGKNRNMLTTNATARLLAEIVTGRIAAPDGTKR
jgi:hypothetical protein